jgi:hypothetical protein
MCSRNYSTSVSVAPESREAARRVWARRSLSVWRNPGSGMLRVSVEVPIEEGELLVRALDRAVADGEAITRGTDFGAEDWPAQQADALIAIARAYLEPRSVKDNSASRGHSRSPSSPCARR